MPDEMPTKVGNQDDVPMHINLVGRTPHVFAYRMWLRRPGEDDWTLFHQGHTEDDIPEHVEIDPLPDGTLLIVWVSAAGERRTYEFLLTLAQDGAICPGGTVTRRGRLAEGEKVGIRRTKLELV